MAIRTARCACGSLGVTCSGEPLKVSLCHCRQCQMRTGSAFGVAAFFRRADVAVSGPATLFTRSSDRGFAVQHHFCPGCGSTVLWEPQRLPDLVAVAVGAFADPGFPPPTQAVHGETRHPWLALAIDHDG